MDTDGLKMMRRDEQSCCDNGIERAARGWDDSGTLSPEDKTKGSDNTETYYLSAPAGGQIVKNHGCMGKTRRVEVEERDTRPTER